jgi:hypothetical protein
MTVITHEHIKRLIELESKINYDSPPLKGDPFTIVAHESTVLISAPHGARTFRNNKEQVWHEEDEYTAGMALLLGEICMFPIIATNCRNDRYDPNYTPDLSVAYKQTLGRLIQQYNVRFVIDLHGAALYSEKLDPKQTIDLGLRQGGKDSEPSIEMAHVEKLDSLLSDTGTQCDASCFVVGRNKFPGAGKGTVITYAVSQKKPATGKNVQAIQIEMKPQVRIANRFPTATLYKSCGPYQAQTENVMHMLQSLVTFIDCLKEIEE